MDIYGKVIYVKQEQQWPSTEPRGIPCLISMQEDLYLFTIILLESL